MLQKVMIGPFGNKFLKEIRGAGRSVFLWTINDEESMKWSIMKGVDGVITDDPKKYLDLARNYDGEQFQLSLKQVGTAIWINILSTFFGFVFRFRYTSKQPRRTGGEQRR